MDVLGWMAAFSALALGHSIFLSIYCWRLETDARLQNRLLALLLLALALRISKSVIVVLFPESPDLFPAIGLVGMAAIGPFLWLYTRSLLLPDFAWQRRHYLHFLPAGLLLLNIPWLREPAMYLCYQLTVAHLLAYVLASSLSAYRSWMWLQGNKDSRHWMLLLHLGVGLIWAAFFAQLSLETKASYVAVTMTAALVLYGMSIWAMRKRQLFTWTNDSFREKKIDAAMEELAIKVQHLFEEEQIFTDSNLNLQQVADRLNSQAYLVSRAVNLVFEKTFPELLYTYRVRAAEELLRSVRHKHLSVEAIAFEAGFHSLSAFYTAFKKLNHTTPARYREQAV